MTVGKSIRDSRFDLYDQIPVGATTERDRVTEIEPDSETGRKREIYVYKRIDRDRDTRERERKKRGAGEVEEPKQGERSKQKADF